MPYHPEGCIEEIRSSKILLSISSPSASCSDKSLWMNSFRSVMLFLSFPAGLCLDIISRLEFFSLMLCTFSPSVSHEDILCFTEGCLLIRYSWKPFIFPQVPSDSIVPFWTTWRICGRWQFSYTCVVLLKYNFKP